MDAPAEDDLRLQRVSGGLLAEFGALLPHYLWASIIPAGPQDASRGRANSRKCVKQSKTNYLIKLLEPFQEWPQLVDPHLNGFVQSLVSAFLDYSSNYRECYTSSVHRRSEEIIPLPRGICRILYTLCKVRGEKVISQLLNNEAKYLDSMVLALRDWNETQGTALDDRHDFFHSPMTWEEKYVMLLWLSHLLLTPFHLESISSLEAGDVQNAVDRFQISQNLPSVVRMITDCVKYLGSPGKEREAARLVLVRLVLRPDMRDFQLLDSFMEWALSHFQATDNPPLSIYAYIGILSFLNGIFASNEKTAAAPYVTSVFEVIQEIVAQESLISREIFSSALGRKLLVKIFRSITLQALRSDSSSLPSDRPNLVEEVLEVTVDQLLTFLADKDTPVRCAASKALSAITIALEPSLATDIVEAIVGSLDENVLWEDATTGQVVGHDDIQSVKPGFLKRNLTAVSPLRWHGLVLTLSYLIYRRSPPAEQLSSILNSLILALGFEQRSSSGSSIGTSVRDAACFGMWALARRYTTAELLAVNISAINVVKERASSSSLLQIISCELLAAATLDSSGNIRRGASAALQELIGRHPDTVVQGIPLVQIVDYQAVSLRSRAMLEIAVDAARLDEIYEQSIISGLLGWRGVGSPDAPSRRSAASAIGLIAASGDQEKMASITEKVCQNLKTLQARQIEARHGLLYALAMIIREAGAQSTRHPRSATRLQPKLTDHWNIFKSVCSLSYKDLKVSASRSDVTAEAACILISALSLEAYHVDAVRQDHGHLPSPENLDSCINILNWSLLLTEDNVVKVSSSTAKDLFQILDVDRREALVQSWATPLRKVDASSGGNSDMLVGYLAALGAVAHHVSPATVMHTILDALLCQINASRLMTSRVAAVKSLSVVLMSCQIMNPSIIEALQTCLDDYTNDQRGDIGSHLRIEGIDAVAVALQHGLLREDEGRQSLTARVCRLAGEKLDKVRIHAWRCLQDHWAAFVGPERPCIHFDDPPSVSTPEYYEQLLALRSIDWLRRPILTGYVSSAGAGSESLIRSSRAALVVYVDRSSASDRTNLFADLLTILHRREADDRLVIPTLAIVAFLLHSAVSDDILGASFAWRAFFGPVQQCHYRSSSIHKLTIAVHIYGGLARHADVRQQAIDQMCRMLLHPFPLVRNATADGLFLVKSLDDLRRVNWAMAPKDLKAVVHNIRRQLGVDGATRSIADDR